MPESHSRGAEEPRQTDDEGLLDSRTASDETESVDDGLEELLDDGIVYSDSEMKKTLRYLTACAIIGGSVGVAVAVLGLIYVF